MLRLRSSILTHLISSSSAFPNISSLHRLLSAATAPRISPNPSFAAEQYLVDTCGLTRAQALKAFAKLSHLKSSSNPDAVLAFLAGLGLSSADVTGLVAKDPLPLCAGVERTLAPIVVGLTGLGLSHAEIARLVSLAPFSFRQRSIVSDLPYYLSVFGSYENLLRVLKSISNLLGSSIEKVVEPNVAFLRECGLSACDNAKLFMALPWLVTSNLERLRAMVACAEGIGVPRGSGMFRQALQAVAFLSEEKIAAKVDYLKRTFRWSGAEVRIAVSKAPSILRMSKESLQLKSDFLISEVGLEPAYIARLSIIITFSLEGRIRPMHYVVKFLKENGLLKRNWGYHSIVKVTEKEFVETFICPHKEAALHLAEDYAAACTGEVPARLIFAPTQNVP